MRQLKRYTVVQSSAVYGLGFLGAIVYYWQSAITFVDGLIGIFKALVWPAILVYDHLKMING